MANQPEDPIQPKAESPESVEPVEPTPAPATPEASADTAPAPEVETPAQDEPAPAAAPREPATPETPIAESTPDLAPSSPAAPAAETVPPASSGSDEAPAAIPAPAPAATAATAATDTPAPKAKAAKGKGKKAEAVKEAPKPVSFSLDDDLEKPKIVKAKGSKNIHRGVAHVQATFNNTIVSITDQTGAVIGWSSAGKCGFKGSRKSTAYAAQVVAQDACRQAMGHGLKEVEVRVKGPGSGRESAVRAMQAIGLEISAIRDVTPVPHNGCRPPKQRRV